MLGSMIQFFVEQGQIKLAERVENHITAVCKTRGPEYDAVSFLLTFILVFYHPYCVLV
jgi:hypothetical protein